MKRTFLFILLSFFVLIVHAQDYLINFSGTGSSTTVETVTVENLTQGKSITLSGSKTLHLMGTVTGNTPLLEYMDYPMVVFPNPSSGDFTVQFDAQKSGMVTVAIYDISGREINKLQQRIQSGFQSFKVAGLSNGVYTVQVLLEDQKLAQKVICNGKSNLMATISYSGFSEAKQKETTLKNATIEQVWQYNTGDRLKFQGTSGKNSTIVMDVPTQSKTLSFHFVECTDADGNNYPVVKIGNQLWMAENLKTTKYNDGEAIPNVTNSDSWISVITGAYCWYNNDANTNKSTYGALYNWYAVNTGKLAPKGWHVPTDAEWTTLTDYIGGINSAGGKLKEMRVLHWSPPNTGATNETGFTGLPSGLRDNGVFYNLGKSIGFWTSTLYPLWNTALSRTLGSDINLVYIGNPRARENGISVRCILNPFSVTTMSISNITQTTATCGGNVISDGGTPVTARGVCWSTSPNPTIGNSKTNDGMGNGNFTSTINGLTLNTTYYVRAYATNSTGTLYGNELTVTTLTNPLTRIEIQSNTSKIKPWQSLQLSAIGYDVQGNKFVLSKCKWESSDSLRISVSPKGIITGNLIGSSTISAIADGLKGKIVMAVDIDSNLLVSKNVLLDSLGSGQETSVAFNPKNPLNIAASANWTNYSSLNGGRDWNKIGIGTDGLAMADPNVCFLYDGTFLRQGLSWAPSPRGIVVQQSNDGGQTMPANQAYWAYKPIIDPLTSKVTGNADQGIMCSDTVSSSKFLGSVYVITSDYPGSAPSYKQIGFSLLVLVSRDGGKTWLDPVDISSCLDCGQEHSSYITTGPKGEVYAAWWNLKNQIVFSKSLDGGITWDKEKVVRTFNQRANQYLLTDDVRGNITIDVDRGNSSYKGRIYISGSDNNGANGGASDAWIINSTDGGNSWSADVLLSDGPKGPFKYYFQPRISVAPNGRIDAVWYDTRNWKGTDINAVDFDLYYANSTNGGLNFSANIRVTSKSATKVTHCTSQSPCGDRQLYEYIGLVSDNNRAMPVWTTVFDGRATPAFSTIWIK